MDNDLGEKNLMWSLRGSQSEEKLRNNLQSADTTMFRRRLAEIGQSWISQLFRSAYPVYSRTSTSKLEVVIFTFFTTSLVSHNPLLFYLSRPLKVAIKFLAGVKRLTSMFFDDANLMDIIVNEKLEISGVSTESESST